MQASGFLFWGAQPRVIHEEKWSLANLTVHEAGFRQSALKSFVVTPM